MCGIAGILGKNVSNKQILLQMLQKQRHRGPDALVQWNQDDVFLGHNRLSILDLSEAANQPMTSACGRYTIVFNGEIYNYVELKKNLHYPFKTNSDTEVLLAMYVTFGKEMLQDLNGMFSFAIWDDSEKTLFAARDRFGVKPFYYAFSGGQFYFASEIKTLLQAGINSTKNETVWADYFVHGSYGLPNETFYENIVQLPGGHSLTIHVGETKPAIARYYDFVAGIRHQQVYGMEEELKAAYTALLYDSISLRFRSDVPVGFNVSGGLDSSILLALISDVKHNETEKIEAFTFYTGDSRYDELPWVEQLIAKTKNPLNAVQLHVEDLPDLIHQIAYYQDEPYGGFPTIAYSLLFNEARYKGIKVLLDGQGMDESWAGYDYYQTDSQAVVQGVKSTPTRANVLKPEFAKLARKIEYPEPFDNALQNKQYRDLFYTKIPRALRFNDRDSMMYSTELREPFLDYRLVEMAFAQAPEMKIKNGQGKWLLRQLVHDKLGDIALSPKRPLQTPQREWIKDMLRNYINESIDVVKQHAWFDAIQLEKEWKEYIEGDSDNSFYIWQWVNFKQIME